MNTRVHILSGMDLVYKWPNVLHNGLKSIQNNLNVFNYRYIQSQLLSVLLFLFLLSTGCHACKLIVGMKPAIAAGSI